MRREIWTRFKTPLFLLRLYSLYPPPPPFIFSHSHKQSPHASAATWVDLKFSRTPPHSRLSLATPFVYFIISLLHHPANVTLFIFTPIAAAKVLLTTALAIEFNFTHVNLQEKEKKNWKFFRHLPLITHTHTHTHIPWKKNCLPLLFHWSGHCNTHSKEPENVGREK